MSTLTLTLMSGQNLPANDVNGKSDPYVVMTLGNMKFKSKCIKANLNPQWNEMFTFTIANPSIDQITLKCYDKDTFSSDDLLGTCVFPVANLPKNKEKVLTLQLTGKKARGNLIVKCKANGFGKVEQKPMMMNQGMMQGGMMQQPNMMMQQPNMMMQGGMMQQPNMMQGGMMQQPNMMQGGMMQQPNMMQGGMMQPNMMQGGMMGGGMMMDKKDMKKMQKKQKKAMKKMEKKMKKGKK